MEAGVVLRQSVDEATKAGLELVVAELPVLSGVASLLANLHHDELRREFEDLGRDKEHALVPVPRLLDAHLVLLGARREADVVAPQVPRNPRMLHDYTTKCRTRKFRQQIP